MAAIIEIVSPGSKNDAAELGALVEKTVTTLSKGLHVALVDLHPPGRFGASASVQGATSTFAGRPPFGYTRDGRGQPGPAQSTRVTTIG